MIKSFKPEKEDGIKSLNNLAHKFRPLNMSSFDEHAENLLQAIDQKWNQDLQNDELVLAFTVGANREQGLPSSLLQLVEVTPSSENTGEQSIIDAKPCSYLDCSGIKYGTLTDILFASVVILNRYLEKVRSVKVLIFIPYNKLTEQVKLDDNYSWSSTIFSCPAIHLLHEISQTLKPISFGLVVIQDVESEQVGRNFGQLLIDQLTVILTNRFVEDPCPKLQLHLDFLKLIVRKDIEFMILLLQNYRWDGTVKSLVDLKSPTGQAIIKFHQQDVRVTDKICCKYFLSTLKKVHDGHQFTAISSRLQTQLVRKINWLTASILNSVLKQYSLEAICFPKQESHALELAQRLCVAIEFCISSGSFVEFMELIILLDYPLDTEVHLKLSAYFTQLKSITEISNILDIDIEQKNCQVNLKHDCKIFHEKLKKKLFPILAADLENERKEICLILQNAHGLITQSLIDFYRSKFLPENLSQEKSRHKAIEMLGKDEKLLETVELMGLAEPETSSSLQVTAYEKLCKKPGYELCLADLLEEINQLKILQDRHKSVDSALQRMGHQYISCTCRNHSTSSIFREIRKHVNEVKYILIKCSALVQEIKSELDSFLNYTIVKFEEEQICAGLDIESLPEKLNKINCLLESLKERQNKFRLSTCGQLITESEQISELFQNSGSEQKTECEKGSEKLETFLELIQQENVRADIYKDLVATSVNTNLLERLTGLKKLVTILINMKESLSSSKFQSNQQLFSHHASQIHCRLLNLLFDNLPDDLGCMNLKINTIKTNSPVTYLCLAKEIVKFLHPRNTKVELISDKVLQITGNFVKFSDFVCNEVAIHNKDLKEIHAFATQRIFVNEDYCDLGGREMEITLISPSIEIVGRRAITLNGKPGKKSVWSLANAGIEFGQDGENGMPGKPGGNGGHLYLICEQLINATSLTVSVQGGNGGAGQNGGNGCSGAPGRSAEASDLSVEQTEKDGDPGSPGGNGGDGGMGGYPGHEGSVEVIALEKYDCAIKVIRQPGELGMHGKGGCGGKGGISGNGIRRIWGLLGTKTYSIPSSTRAAHGKPGRYGANSTNQVLPPPKKSKPDSKATVISELRKFYMNQSNNWSMSVTRNFMERIDLKLEFQHVTVKSLAQDLLNLELTSRNFHNPDSLIEDHEAFQYRLHRYVHLVLFAEQQDNEEIKHVIKLLYAQSISKVIVLKEYQGGGPCSSGAQVINLLGYFDIIKETINRLKESNLEVHRREALKTYHDLLKAKCDDTKEFISRIVLPSIAEAKKKIQAEMNCCAAEVEFYRRMVDADLKCRYDAARASERIQFWDKIKIVFTVLEFGIGVAMWLNASKFAGKALLAIAGFKDSIKIDEDDKRTKKEIKQPNIQLPVCLNDFHVTIEHKMTRMCNECELVNRFLEANHGDGGNHVFARINPNLEAWQDQVTRCRLLLNLMKEGKSALGEELEELVVGMEKNKAEILNVLHEMSGMKSTDGFKLSSDLIDNIKHLLVDMALANCDSPQKNLITMRQSSSEPSTIMAQGQLQSVQEKYSAIFQNIVPLMNAIFGTVQNKLGTNENDSYASQKFEKWRIQTSLRKLKEKLCNFFNGLESKECLIQAVQQMDEGLSILIDLYDIMDNYEESKLFSEALAGIQPNSNSKDFADLQEIVDTIGYLLQANTFILDYNQAVHAFKQWIFPFANKCPIPTLNFESDLTCDLINLENHIEKLAAEYKAQFSIIHGHLLRYRSMKMDFDDAVFRGLFSSNSSACPPFYVWKCEEWGNTIKRFLKGEEVELRADLMKAEEFSERKLGAVKFKTVQLKIKHKCGMQEEEEELNKIMKLFKVTMVHSGLSYYKVFDQCFVMRGSRNEYCYSFDGATKNSTYEKSENQGDCLLSPFTIWKFQINEIMQGTGGFKRLNKFENEVDLELWGDGLYLDEGKAKQKKLDKKYLKDLHLHYELVNG